MIQIMRRWVVFGAIGAIGLVSCTGQPNSGSQKPTTNPITQLKAVPLDKTKLVMGQTVYVPIYSQIYHYREQDQVMNLSATLSIRNTASAHSIIITTVKYYDTNGQLIREYIQQPVELKPLASTDVFIQSDDVEGGAGANFIVEWAAEKPVYQPVIEAVMISTASNQGISFISPGRVLRQYGQPFLN